MAEWLWRGLELQLLWALLALGGALLVPGGALPVPGAGRRLCDRLGLGPGRLRPAGLALGLVGFIALSNGLHRAIVALGGLEGTALAELERLVREASARDAALALLVIGLAPALGEELLFRGFLLRWLASRVRGPAAVLGSAALFGAAHLEPVHAAAAFVLGVYLGTLGWRAGSVRAPMLCHAANNTLAVLGARGLVPQPGPAGDLWLAGLALAVAAACLALASGLLQPRPPPADPERGPDEGHSSGTDRR
jgi:hypothetical protein